MWAKLFTPLSIPGKKYNTTPRSVVFILIYLRKYYEIRILLYWHIGRRPSHLNNHLHTNYSLDYIEELLVQFKLFFSSLSTPSNLFKEELGYISLYEYIL